MDPSESVGVVPLKEGSGKPRFAQIRDYILDLTSRGELKPGQRLPTLRKWAEDSGVAYETMSRAIRELVAGGVLETCPGRGTQVASGAGRRQRVGAVGVVTLGSYEDLMRSSRYYGMLMPIAHDELVAHHERVVSERWSPDKPMTDMFDRCRLVDGILLLGNVPYPVAEIEALESLGIPVISLGGEIESSKVWIVKCDDFGDSRNAVLRLSQGGHERIAAWVDEDDPRRRGYAQGVEDAGLAFPPLCVTESRPDEVARLLIEADPMPSALLIARNFDRVGGLLEAFRRRGVRLGEDLYLCSFDDDLWNNIVPLGIAYSRIEQPMREIAHEAAKVLMGRIEGSVKGPMHTLLSSRFVEVPAR